MNKGLTVTAKDIAVKVGGSMVAIKDLTITADWGTVIIAVLVIGTLYSVVKIAKKLR